MTSAPGTVANPDAPGADTGQPPAQPLLLGRALAAALLLLLAVLATYASVRQHGYLVYDDPAYVLENPQVRAGLSWDGLRWALTTGHFAGWRPVTWLSHMLDVELFGLDASRHHLTSAGLHALASAVLLLVFATTTGRVLPSLIAAALFALHPLRVESVAWIAQRRDVLAALFGALTLASYVGWTRRGGRLRYAGLLSAYALGLAAKPTWVSLPLLLLLLDRWPLGRPLPLRRLVLEKLPLVVLSLAAAIVEYATQGAGRALAAGGALAPSVRAANAILSVTTYGRRLLWPDDLAVFYPHPGLVGDAAPTLASAPVLLSAAVLALLTGAAWAARRRHPALLCGWLWFLVALLPVLGLVQVGAHALADRYTYLPAIGLTLAVVHALAPDRAAPAWRARLFLAAGALAALVAALTTARQLATWRTDETLFERALAVTRDNLVAHYNLGYALRAVPGQEARALEHFLEARRIQPDFVAAHLNAGLLLERLGRRDEAAGIYRQGLSAVPDHGPLHGTLGLLLVDTDPGLAEEHLARSLELDPGQPILWNALGRVLQARGALEAANAAWLRAQELLPDWVEPLVRQASLLLERGDLAAADQPLGRALALAPGDPEVCFSAGQRALLGGEPAAATAHLQRAVASRPGWGAAHYLLGVAWLRCGDGARALEELRRAAQAEPLDVPAATDLAWLLATHSDDDLRDGPEAVRWAERADAASGHVDPRVLAALAAAWAEVGRFEEAVAAQRRGWELAPPAERAGAQKRLELYQSAQPYRERP